MPQMAKDIELPDFTKVKSIDDMKNLLVKFVNNFRQIYQNIHNDVNFKETVYFTARGKKWRITILPDKDGTNEEHLRVQRLTGTDWRNPDHWTDEHVFAGGSYTPPS